MKSSPSRPEKNSSEVNSTILEWIEATLEFHCYHRKINAILENRDCNWYVDSTRAASVNRSNRIRSLNKLSQHMNHVLTTLMADMGSVSQGTQYTDNNAILSRTGRLVTHARLLKDVNRKIGQELLLFNDFQA